MRTDPEEAIERLLALLDLQGKVRLVTGANFWTTQADQTIGLRSMVLSDGPVGVRGQRWDERDPSVAPPSPTALAATWDEPLVERLGGLLAAEARRKGVDILLTPTVNLHRTPLGGRHFECLSEDPLLSGRIGAAYVRGLQAHGVAATAKHYVANDSETNRFTVDVRVDERALHELYLAPFEQLVVEGGAWLVMAAYNSVNGVTMTENPLLRDPLKTDWGSMAWSCPTGGRPAPLNQPPRAGWILLCRGRTAHGAPPWPPRSMMAGSRRRRWTTRYGASCGWQPASAPWKESRPTHPSRASRRRNRLRRCCRTRPRRRWC
jgi:Glycosyl hydrolase family 3 N terminal domain